MEKRTAVSDDESHVLQLLQARYGSARPHTRLRTLLKRNPQLDPLDWSLLVMSIEIDARVSLSRNLLDPNRWTVAQFARSVAALPKVASVTHTIELLTLLSEELLRAHVIPKATLDQPKPRLSKKPGTSRRTTARAVGTTKKRP